MRLVVVSVTLAAALLGCARSPSQPTDPWTTPAVSRTGPPTPANPAKPTGPIVTPSADTVGRVISTNPRGRYAVLSYSLGSLPALDTRVYAYRAGLKVAELRVTGPAKDYNTIADLLTGECQVGDEIRTD